MKIFLTTALLFILGIVALGEAHAGPARTKTGLCVGDYSLTEVDGHFVANPPAKGCPTITIHEAHAKPTSWVSYWYSLDEQCRGGSGDAPETMKACDKRSDIDKILINQGCIFRYPNGWPELKGEYWKCSK